MDEWINRWIDRWIDKTDRARDKRDKKKRTNILKPDTSLNIFCMPSESVKKKKSIFSSSGWHWKKKLQIWRQSTKHTSFHSGYQKIYFSSNFSTVFSLSIDAFSILKTESIETQRDVLNICVFLQWIEAYSSYCETTRGEIKGNGSVGLSLASVFLFFFFNFSSFFLVCLWKNIKKHSKTHEISISNNHIWTCSFLSWWRSVFKALQKPFFVLFHEFISKSRQKTKTKF